MRLIDQVKKLLSDNQEMSALELVKGLQDRQSEVTANTISTRVDEKTLHFLQEIATEKKMTLSEHMREVLEEDLKNWGYLL